MSLERNELHGNVIFLETERIDRRLREVFENVHLRFERFSPVLQEHFRLLLKKQPTFEDEVECASFTHDVDSMDIERRLNVMDWFHVQQASLSTDIGKTGPIDATQEQKDLITSMYGSPKSLPGNPRDFTIRDFFEMNKELTLEEEEHFHILEAMGITPDMDMRTFFNLHAGWTYGLLKNETEIPEETKVLASLHHFLEGVNPNNLVDLSTEELMIPSLGRPLGRKEIWTILFDKYQAQRAPHRGNQKHEAAIAWLRRFVNKPDLANRRGVQLQPYPEWLNLMLNTCITELDEGIKKSQEEKPALVVNE